MQAEGKRKSYDNKYGKQQSKTPCSAGTEGKGAQGGAVLCRGRDTDVSGSPCGLAQGSVRL
jgi:hypothetical protein